jgi:predicted GNAT family acetyltransferase
VEEISFPTVDGYSRDATLSDFDLVNAWTNDFIKFIDDAHHTPTEADLETLRHRISANSRKLWIDHDEPVSMAGHAEAVETPGGLVTRIGPVYTPDNFRGRGYGSAVTAALSDELLRGGSRVMLYADQANPTSNSIYQTIGYRLLDHVVQYDRATTTHT